MVMMFLALILTALVAQSLGAKVFIEERNTLVLVNADRQQDIIEDVGDFTEYLNCDESSGKEESIGDYETSRRCRALEVERQECLIPCDKPAAMECRSAQIKFVTVEFVYKTCLNLTDEQTDPERGLYAMDAHARQKYGGACDKNDREGQDCKDTLGDRCDAPDSECRRYCAEDKATRNAYRAQRLKEIHTTRTLAVKALKSMVQNKMKTKRGFFQSSSEVRDALSKSLFKRALDNEENEELILLSRLLKDDTIDWDN